MKGENMYCPEQRGISREYREGYDQIKWDTDDKEEPRENPPDKQGDD